VTELLAAPPAPEPTQHPLSKRWARDREDFVARHPAAARRLRWLMARPAVVLLPWAGLVAGLLGADNPGGDASWFREAGLSMLGPEVLDVFAAPGVQMGPVYLLFIGVLTTAVDAVGLPVLFTVAAVQAIGIAWFALFTTRRWAVELGAAPLRAQWGVVAPMAFGGLLAESIGNGHPEEIFLGLLFANIALMAQRGAGARVGALVGLATGIKLWGLLAAPVLLVGRAPRTIMWRVVAALAVALAFYLPFFLFGEVNTFSFRWGNTSTPLSMLAHEWGLSDWGMRLIQGGAVAVVGSAVAWRRRGSGLAVVLTIIAVRLVLDPLLMTYYPGPFIAVALIWLWTWPTGVRQVWQVLASLAVPLTIVLPYLTHGPARAWTTQAAYLAVTIAVLWRERREGGREGAGERRGLPDAATL